MNPESDIKHFALEEEELWKEELKNNGVVVIRSIISEEEVRSTTELFWEWLEAIGTGIKRENP